MSDENLSKARGKSGISRQSQARMWSLTICGNPALKRCGYDRRDFSRPNQKMERPKNRIVESGCEIPGSGNRSRAPVRWERDHLHLDRLPEQNQPGMENKSGHEHLGKLADWNRWQRKRGCVGAGKANPGGNRICGVDLRDSEQNAIRGGEKFRGSICKADNRISNRRAHDCRYSR